MLVNAMDMLRANSGPQVVFADVLVERTAFDDLVLWELSRELEVLSASEPLPLFSGIDGREPFDSKSGSST